MRTLWRMAILLLVLTSTPLSMAQEAPPAVPGNAQRGAALLTGSIAFNKGAAPCTACHAVSAKGINGARMASDLSGLFSVDGADSIKDIIGAVEAPVMKKIYATRPLTDTELADLAAFARQPAPDKQPERGLPLPLAGAGAAILFLIVLALYKRRIS